MKKRLVVIGFLLFAAAAYSPAPLGGTPGPLGEVPANAKYLSIVEGEANPTFACPGGMVRTCDVFQACNMNGCRKYIRCFCMPI